MMNNGGVDCTICRWWPCTLHGFIIMKMICKTQKMSDYNGAASFTNFYTIMMNKVYEIS